MLFTGKTILAGLLIQAVWIYIARDVQYNLWQALRLASWNMPRSGKLPG